MISCPLLIMSMLCWETLQFVTDIPTIPSLRKRSRSKQVHTVWNFPRKWILLSHFMLWNSKQIPDSFALYTSSLLLPIDVAIMHIKVCQKAWRIHKLVHLNLSQIKTFNNCQYRQSYFCDTNHLDDLTDTSEDLSLELISPDETTNLHYQ